MPELATRVEKFSGVPALVGAQEYDVDVLLKLANRKKPPPFQTTVLRYNQSDELRRWYFGLVQHVADALGIYSRDLHKQLKFKVKLVKDYLLGETGPVVVLGSIARTEMDELELREYVAHAEVVVFEHYVPQIERTRLYDEIIAKYGPRPL